MFPKLPTTDRRQTIWLSMVVLLVFVVAGFYQRSLTEMDRRQAAKLIETVKSIAIHIENWDDELVKLDPESLGLGNIRGYQKVRLRSARTGSEAEVLIACGPYHAMLFHRPEICVTAGGLRQINETQTVTIDYADSRLAEFAFADFQSDTIGRQGRFRVYYTFNSGDRWVADSDARRDADELPYLVKTYVSVPLPYESKNMEAFVPLLKEILRQVDDQIFKLRPNAPQMHR